MPGWQIGEYTLTNIIHVDHRGILNVYNLRTEVFSKQILSLVEMVKFTSRCGMIDIPIVPSVWPIRRTNHIDLHVCKNINQSEPEGHIQSNQRFFFLVASRLVFITSRLSRSSFMWRKIQRREKSRKTSGTRLI